METFLPYHQFEIRFNTILNFPNVVRNTIAPFVKLANRITIDNEGSHSERIVLAFDEQSFQIDVMWDRVLIRIESEILANYSENNSLIEEPFFNIFNKLTELDNFGEIKNILFFSIFVLPLKKEFNEILSDFSDRYFNKEIKSFANKYDDIGIAIEKHDGNIQTLINIGPFIGVNDIKKRNLELRNPKVISKLGCVGEMLDFKYFDVTKKFSFKDYKKIFSLQFEYLDKLWHT